MKQVLSSDIANLKKLQPGQFTFAVAVPVLIIPIFLHDFLCIHPFNDGNGGMSRLMTLLLLYKSGYLVGKYISIEKHIEKTKDAYYDALEASLAGWHEEEDPVIFVNYMSEYK